MSQIMGPQVFLLCTMFSMITWILLQINNREIDEFEQILDKSLKDPGKDLLFVNGKGPVSKIEINGVIQKCI